MSSYERWRPERASEIIKPLASQPGALMPILHALQAAFGHVPDEATPIVAEALNLSRADVHGVLTFYHDFRHEMAGRKVLKLCQAEACQARGARGITAQAQSRLGIKLGETTEDGLVTLEAIYCLGLCASGPAALLDGAPVARIDAKRMDELVEEAVS